MTLARQLTVAMVSVALMTGALVAVLVGYGVSDAVRPAELARLETDMRSGITGLQAYVHGARSDTIAALRAAPIPALLAAHARGLPLPSADRTVTVNIFRALLEANPQYLQLRLIAADKEGHELVRLERKRAGEPVRVVPDFALQSKAHRPYVQNTLKLRDAQVYVSPIELNQEHGQVEVPHVPVLRTAVPSLAHDGTPAGMVVLNVDVGPALYDLQRTLRRVTHALYLFDQSGNFLLHPDPGRAFGLDLGTGETFTRSFPELKGLLSATKPWEGMARDRTGKRVRHLAVPFSLLQGPKLILLAGGVSEAGVATRGAQRAVLTAALMAVAFASLAAVWLSRRVTRPLDQMIQLAERYPDAHSGPLPIDALGEIGSLARALARMDQQIRERNALLEHQQLRFRRMFEAAPHATLIIDPSQHVVLANARAETLFGYDKAELMGSDLALLLPAAVRTKHRQLAADFFVQPSTRAMAMGRTFEIRRKDGTPVHVEIGLAPLASEDGAEVLASIVDVSGRVRSEVALRQSNQELQQFAYVASHDLQEPLRMVANYTELLARRYEGKLDEKADKYIRFAVDGAKRMQRLISDLLAYSRVESQGGSFGRVDLNTTVRQVLDSLQLAVDEAGAKVQINPLPAVSADLTQMRQLFQNLLDNAIKFRAERPPQIVISASEEPQRRDRVRVSVQDNGIGIDMQRADKLFEMFQRGHGRDRYPGTGIGLAVSKRVVERHGGKLWVGPTPGGGATFYFTLPLAASGRGT